MRLPGRATWLACKRTIAPAAGVWAARAFERQVDDGDGDGDEDGDGGPLVTL
jgi:hypothetical protein